jgi:uncharacterized protein (DUF2252 family)
MAVKRVDETLPGPFEYDVKRMAASFTIAARNNGFSKADARSVTRASVTAYREAMAGFAGMGTLVPLHDLRATSDQFDRAVTDFSQRYADQNERDYEALVGAVRSGRLQALVGV